MTRTPLTVAIGALLACAAPAPAADLQPLNLTRIAGTTPPGSGDIQAEIAAYHPATQRIFATNARNGSLDVYSITAPGKPIAQIKTDGGPNSVAVRRDGLVAVAVEHPTSVVGAGHVEFYDAETYASRGSAPTGVLPDMLTFTPDGQTVVVADEAQPSDDYTTDPEGSVTLVDTADLTTRTARFDSTRAYPGVRIFGPGATAAQDFEPEYIAVDPDGRTAYVTLQENNAIAVLDLKHARFTAVRGLGFKDWGETGADMNTNDKAIGIEPRPGVFGMYQPDAIAPYSLNGKTHLVTANEGDARAYGGFNEEGEVGGNVALADGFPGGDELTGLKVTRTLGDEDGDGRYEALYAFGARSLSVLDHTGRVRFDTGDGLERYVADWTPSGFNANHSAAAALDNRSDDKGPEPEGLAVGDVDGRTFAFLGLERHSGLVAYDLAAMPGAAVPAGRGIARPTDRGPEGVVFVPAADSPTGEPLVLVTNEVTSTIGIWEVTQP